MYKRQGLDGKIAIGEVLKMAKIQPGDWVEIKPVNNKITIKTVKSPVSYTHLLR